MQARRPISPVNTHDAPTSGALVKPSYPTKKLTETTIDTCAVAPRPALVEFTVLPCKTCKDHADKERANYLAKYLEKHPAPIDGAHNPYVQPPGNSNKRNKQSGAPVARSHPNSCIHALPEERGVHHPYSAAGWNGVCTEQDICKMLGADKCICSLTEEVPKCMVACLDWVNCGTCDPSKRGLTACPYAHPDLTQVHPDVCCNFLLTGICRFRKTEEQTVVPTTEGQKKKRNNKKNGPSDCLGCHCAAPEDGAFPLLPGLTKKILRPLRTEGTGQEKRTVEWDCTDLDRALAFYKAYLNRH
jgi:hypothetical protein